MAGDGDTAGSTTRAIDLALPGIVAGKRNIVLETNELTSIYLARVSSNDQVAFYHHAVRLTKTGD